MIFAEYVEQEIERADILSERMFRKAVVRKGKKVYKWKTDKAGKYRIQFDKNGRPKEVRMSKGEKLKRSRGQNLKGKIKRKGKKNKTIYQKMRSFIARKNAGLGHYDLKNPTKNPSRDEKGAKKAKTTGESNDRGMK